MKTVKLIQNTVEDNYSQIYQKVNVKFSFLHENNGTYTELFPRVLCRDYLSDCVISSKMKGPVNGVYGFKLDKSIDTTRLLISVEVVHVEMFLKGLRAIRKLEKSFKGNVTPLVVYKTDAKDVFIIEGDIAWQGSSIAFSILSYLLRIINYKRVSHFYNVDKLLAYIEKSVLTGVDLRYATLLRGTSLPALLENIDEILGENPLTGYNDTYLDPSDMNVRNISDPEYNDEVNSTNNYKLYDLHNNGGIVKLIEGVNNCVEGRHIYSMVGYTWINNYIRLFNHDVKDSNVSVKAGDVVTINGDGCVILRYIDTDGGRICYKKLNSTSMKYNEVSVNIIDSQGG